MEYSKEKVFLNKSINLRISTDDRNLIIFALNELHNSKTATQDLKRLTSNLINYIGTEKQLEQK